MVDWDPKALAIPRIDCLMTDRRKVKSLMDFRPFPRLRIDGLSYVRSGSCSESDGLTIDFARELGQHQRCTVNPTAVQFHINEAAPWQASARRRGRSSLAAFDRRDRILARANNSGISSRLLRMPNQSYLLSHMPVSMLSSTECHLFSGHLLEALDPEGGRCMQVPRASLQD